MTEALRTQIKLKNSMHKDYLKSNNIEVLKSYRDTKRILHSSLKNAEIKYFGDQLELNSNDIFKTWKVLGKKYNILTILLSIAFVVIPIYQHLSTLKLYH